MGSRNPQRRQAKAVRRKKLLAERRRLEAADARGSVVQDVRRTRTAPLHSCLVQRGIFESGFGMVLLTRKIGVGKFGLAAFLVDAFCLGVKDAFFRETEEAKINSFVESFETTTPFEAADLSYARKLLHEAVAYARSLGLEPHADYAAVEPFFGDVAADAGDVQFQFGYHGKPLYVPGPTESPTQIRRRVDRLRRQLGVDGFVFAEMEDPFDALEELEDENEVFDIEEDEDFVIDGGYNPRVAPDPGEWLALDEETRLDRVLDYHRAAGISPPDEAIHAVIHVAVENQIALGEPPVQRAIDRLMAEGLNRHQAVHAAALALGERLLEVLTDPEAKAFPKEAYDAALEQLTIRGPRRDFGDEKRED